MKIVIPEVTSIVPKNSVEIPHYGDYYLNLLGCLGYSPDKAPVADLLKRLHGLSGSWLVASPIYWQATHNDVMIMASGEDLQCHDDEARAWFSAFTELTSAWGFEAIYHHASMWLIQPNQATPIQARPVSCLNHQSMMPELASLDKTMYWQRLLTEAQLFFSAHPLNKKRSKQWPINGVWFWGGGCFQQHPQPLILIQDESLSPLAHMLSKQVESIAARRYYSADTLFLVKNLDQNVLQKINQRRRHLWYWNNRAYQTKPISWLKYTLMCMVPKSV